MVGDPTTTVLWVDCAINKGYWALTNTQLSIVSKNASFVSKTGEGHDGLGFCLVVARRSFQVSGAIPRDSSPLIIEQRFNDRQSGTSPHSPDAIPISAVSSFRRLAILFLHRC
jgi:hypothetical protein